MKLIMENWRKYLGMLKGPSVPKLSPKYPEEPEYDPEYPDRPKIRRTARFDPMDPENPEGSIKKINDHVQQILKSDAPLSLPSDSLKGIQNEIEFREEEITAFEAAETIDAARARRLRDELKSFRDILGLVPTVDVKLMHVGKKLREI